MLKFNDAIIRGYIPYARTPLILILLCVLVKLFSVYSIKPKLISVSSERTAIFARKVGTMTTRGTLDILTSFAQVDSREIWIHSMSIDENNIKLKIRSFTPQAVEKYINKVAMIGSLKIEDMLVKNVDYEGETEEKEEKEEVVIPFAARLFLGMNKEKEEKKEEEDDKEDDAFFSYETEINMFAENR